MSSHMMLPAHVTEPSGSQPGRRAEVAVGPIAAQSLLTASGRRVKEGVAPRGGFLTHFLSFYTQKLQIYFIVMFLTFPVILIQTLLFDT